MVKIIVKAHFLMLAAIVVSGCAQRDLAAERTGAFRTYQAGAYAEAVEKFEKLVVAMPKDADLWFRLGNAYARAMRPKQAVAAYENALLRDPQMAKAWYNKGLIHLQEALKTFIDMQSHVADDDPIGQRAGLMREGVRDLIEAPLEKAANAE